VLKTVIKIVLKQFKKWLKNIKKICKTKIVLKSQKIMFKIKKKIGLKIQKNDSCPKKSRSKNISKSRVWQLSKSLK